MLFTPHIPVNNKGEIKKEFLKKAEDIALKDTELVPNFSETTVEKIRDLLKITNSYYSNLIESEGTKPIDIEEALKKDYDKNDKNYRLKKLAVRYVEIQDKIKTWIKKENPFTKDFILKLHREFYSKDMKEFLEILHDGKTYKMVPGETRKENVQVGKHIAPKGKDIEYLLNTFENLYKKVNNHKKLLSEKILYSLSAHHRLLWIHPFLDGNGRISRLLLDAYFYFIGLKGYGIWTMSRGLAIHQEIYKKYLAIADMEKENEYDGRGFLSLKSLEEYVEKMLFIMEDQIDYMNGVLKLDKVLKHIENFVEMTSGEYLKSRLPNQIIYTLPLYAKIVLKEFFIKGKLKRSEIIELTGKSPRSVDYLMRQLKEMNLVVKESKHSPFIVNIPYYYAEIIFPGIGKLDN